ncbi:hypothetical protein BDN71DRAFT_1586995 [Pleurotus eryngii]|uniref:Uncharacterized protein n=1 Tax=Pleurotus eryngii TaxID=5323 RepID=A0A9P6DIF9_PLEER|nr:hypothetical protein BDN71DRAFT_1586995 [Pleurotus eryngii]
MDTFICASVAVASAALLPCRTAFFSSSNPCAEGIPTVHAKPGVKPHEWQSGFPMLDRQDSFESEDQQPPPSDGSEFNEHSLPPFDSPNAKEKSPPLVDSEFAPPPAELPPLPDQPSPCPAHSSGSDDKPPLSPAELPPLPNGSESNEQSPPVVDSEFTPAADDSLTLQAMIPHGKCNIPSIPGSPKCNPDDVKALEEPPNDIEAEKFTEAGPVSPGPNLIQIPIDTYTHLLDQMMHIFSHLHVSPPPALPAAVAPAIQQGYFPQEPDVLRVVESFKASSKALQGYLQGAKRTMANLAETLERSTHSFVSQALQEELHGAKCIIANLAETLECCAKSNVASIITRQQAMEMDIATLKKETSSLHDRRMAITLEENRGGEGSDLRQCLETQFKVKENSFALEKQELELQVAQLNKAQKQAAQQNNQMTRELKYLRRDYEAEVQKLEIRSAVTHAEAIQCVELLITENKVLWAQNSEITSIAVNQASKFSTYYIFFKADDCRLAACNLRERASRRNDLGLGKGEIHPKVVTKEAEVQAGRSSDVPLCLPQAILHQGVQTDETPVVSVEAKAQAGGSKDTHRTQSSKGVQAEVVHFESEPEMHMDRSSDPSFQSPLSIDTSQDEGALTEEILIVSGEREDGCDDTAPQLPSTSLELPTVEAHGPSHDSDGAQNGTHTPLLSPPQTPAFRAFRFMPLTPPLHDRSLIGPLSPMSPLSSSPENSPVRRNVKPSESTTLQPACSRYIVVFNLQTSDDLALIYRRKFDVKA